MTTRHAALHLAPLLAAAAVASCSDCTREVTDPCHVPVDVTVTRVVDGDTLDVEPAIVMDDDAEVERIRLLCLDTPESGECFHDEATEALRERIEGRTVRLAFADDCVGDFGRGLAYVLVDGTVVNVELAREGYGRLIHEPYDDYSCCDDVSAGEQAAYQEQAGGWGACSGAPWIP